MELKQLTVKLPKKEAEELYALAKKNDITVAEQIRRYIKMGMLPDRYVGEEEKLIGYIKQAMNEVLEPTVEKINKLWENS